MTPTSVFTFGIVAICASVTHGFSTTPLIHGNVQRRTAFTTPPSSIGKTLPSSQTISWKQSSVFESLDDSEPSSLTTTSPITPPFPPSFLHKFPLNLRTAAAVTATTTALLLLTQNPPAAYATSAELASAAASTTTLLQRISETGFYQAFSLVFLSEIGDKTFFIAGLLAMKTSRIKSFIGAMIALGGMTVISCAIGQIFHAIPSGLAGGLPFDDICAVAAFAFFGIKILKEAIESEEGAGIMDEELEEAEEAVGESKADQLSNAWAQIASAVGLVFAAEFGDRSFLTTIALSAAQNPFSVGGGAIVAHGVATGIAVVGGGAIAKYISEKVIGYISGTLFLVFALTTALGIF